MLRIHYRQSGRSRALNTGNLYPGEKSWGARIRADLRQLEYREMVFRHVKQPNGIIVLAYNQGMRSRKGLPESLRPFFWDYRFSNLSLPDDKDLVIRRILSQGSWQAVRWLRKEIGDTELREWLISHQGRGLSPRQLRYWELIYALPPKQVNQWVQNSKNGVWAQR